MNEDFRDLLRAFSDAEVRFLVVGAYAVSIHSEPRATGDLDLWVEPTRENARKVLLALREFGVPLHDISEEDLTRDDLVFQIGLPPRRVDLLTGITGVAFEEAWPNPWRSKTVVSACLSSAGRNSFGTSAPSAGRKIFSISSFSKNTGPDAG
ncbi:MAG: hypothetical protein KatS3mg076_1494 [Candidatus Binatia bacterium]|nr:MAG: hypothetical protein KatS3mg076_1494 [Candidatus Binatia bacterium]